MKDTLVTRILLGLTIGSFLFMCAYALATLLSSLPVEVKEPISIIQKEVKRGGSVTLFIDSCSDDVIEADLEVQLALGDGVTTPILAFNNVTTDNKCTVIPFAVDTRLFPANIESGTYSIRLIATYRLNFAKTVVEQYDSETFKYIVPEK